MKFYYKARTKEGEMRSGEIEASSKDVAALLLRKYELFPTYLEEVKRGGVLKKFAFRKKISKKDLSAFSSQLSVMLESRVPPSESLLAIASQTENEDFRNVIIEISEIVERGSSFSEAISFFPLYFDDFYINLIRAGESTGRISETLKQLAEHLKREYEIQNRIKGALIYPILVLFVAIVVLLIVLLGVIPSLAEIIGDISKASFLARLMFGLSKFVKTWGLVILLFLITIIGFFVFYFRSPKGKETLGKNLVKFPFFGEFFRKIYLARFSEGLSTLISAGLPVTQALKITSGFIGNPLYKEIILQTERAVREGESISSEIMRHPELIPPFFAQMIRTGERTGKLDETLLEVFNFYQKEIEITTETLMTILEPILIILVGIIVAIVGAGIFSAIYGTMRGFASTTF